ncbi:MAG TPA: hypothetical protein VF503_20315 [Sphingobium sp.]|uniref:hypothetical protein n=1 Tax=Sphingobium sp. TaxID=1912891 RepID=UPI002ED01653
MTLSLIITNAGRAALVNAEHSGTDPVTIAQCGLSATAVVPTAIATTLPGEFKRIATLSGSVVDADTIHLIVRDESADAFTVRSVAFYLGDGTLFGIYGQASEILNKTVPSIMLLQVDVKFADIAATSITFGNANFLNPPATETVKGVAEIATQAETDGGTDDTRIVTPKKLVARLTSWLASWGADIWRASNDGAGSGMDSDLLDGQEGSWYSNIIARLGFTPANKAGENFSGPVAVVTGGAQAMLSATGDVIASRPGGTTGAYYFGVGTARYLYFNGTSFNLAGGALYADGALVWNAVNDGAGSGSDSDMLDGQHGSWYADITGRLGYIPLNAVSYTAADVVAKLLTVDGAGSGVDADLLDGQQGAWYADITGRLGFTPVRQGGGAGQGSNVVYIGWGGGRLKGQVDAYDLGNFVFDSNISDVWRASNDGAGSGMDTDLWRGMTPQQLIDSQFSHGSNVNGEWLRRPAGGSAFAIEQRGQNTDFTNTELVVNVPLPVAFANTNYRISCTPFIDTDNSFTDVWVQVLRATKTTTSFQVRLQGVNPSNNYLYGFEWTAIGDAL